MAIIRWVGACGILVLGSLVGTSAWACGFSTAGCRDLDGSCGSGQVCAYSHDLGDCACRGVDHALRAKPRDPKFFANAEFQAPRPRAFVLQPASLDFVRQAGSKTRREGDAFIAAVRSDPGLAQSVLRFAQLSREERLGVMRRLFDWEIRVLRIPPPELRFDDRAPRAAFFDFDPARPGPGRVILNPTQLFKDRDPYAALLLLVHETRHSAQFQFAYSVPERAAGPLALGFRAAFVAQRLIFDQKLPVSFLDFMTLANEYEAFQFGNYAIGVLSGGRADTSGMGSWASQFNPDGSLKIDLLKLVQKVGPARLLDAFNDLEEGQYQP